MARRVAEGADPFDIFRETAGIDELTNDEVFLIASAETPRQYRDAFAKILSDRAGIGWSTSGHTEADVNLYSFGPGSELFRGHMENDEVGRRLFEVLGL